MILTLSFNLKLHRNIVICYISVIIDKEINLVISWCTIIFSIEEHARLIMIMKIYIFLKTNRFLL